jgi:GAF domain-containing protein
VEQIIDQIISIPWLSFESKGSIFLVESNPEMLVLKAQRKLPESLQNTCANVPFGRCICGRAALSKEIEFTDHLDERHDNMYEGISQHGHYCVPILSGNKVLGVINLYVKEGHIQNKREEEFLRAVADVLTSILQRKKAEAKLKQTVDDLEKWQSLSINREKRMIELKEEIKKLKDKLKKSKTI